MSKRRPYISALWHTEPANIHALLAQAVHAGIEAYRKETRSPDAIPTVFFRADDIAIPSPACRTMMEIFAEHETPLALAVVPAWITEPHRDTLLSIAPLNNRLWCWHQHGWSHENNAVSGKKCEFGSDRKTAECEQELQQGVEKLTALFEGDFCPVFTPPWNRISNANIELLKQTGIQAVSRSTSAPKQDILPDIPVNVDLHTRSELTAASGWKNLLAEITAGLATGRCGFMLHHERMNPAAEHFLQRLLITLKSYPVQTVPLNAYML